MIANAGISPVGSILDSTLTSPFGIDWHLVIPSVLQVSVETWDRIMDVNLRGVMLCYKYAALQMIQQGRGGRILGTHLCLQFLCS